MSDVVQESRPRGRAVNPPEIREHRIPTPGSKPYIAMEGFDGCLWFCESGASKIGRFDPDDATLHASSTCRPPNATPIGITIGADGNYVVLRKKAAHRSAASRRRARSRSSSCRRRTPAPTASLLGPDGNVWFSETEVSQIGRITPDGTVTEFSDGISPGASRCRSPSATARCGFREAAGNRVGRITMDGEVTEFPIPSHDSQPRAMIDASRRLDLVRQTSTNSLGRIDREGHITEHKVTTPDASLRGVCVGPDGDLWFTANFANKIGRMRAGRHHARRIRRSRRRRAARAASVAMSNGRLYFTIVDAGLIGEVIPIAR